MRYNAYFKSASCLQHILLNFTLVLKIDIIIGSIRLLAAEAVRMRLLWLRFAFIRQVQAHHSWRYCWAISSVFSCLVDFNAECPRVQLHPEWFVHVLQLTNSLTRNGLCFIEVPYGYKPDAGKSPWNAILVVNVYVLQLDAKKRVQHCPCDISFCLCNQSYNIKCVKCS